MNTVLSITKQPVVNGISETFLYDSVRDKLRDPEKEVRQHALRVLMDLIKVTQPSNLDIRMQDLVPEILKILSHSAPSLRKSALDSLKKYLKLSKNYNYLMRELLNSPDHLTNAAPFLINRETDDLTVILVIEQLWKELEDPTSNQEIPAKSLARLRYNLGDDRFKHLIGLLRYRKLQEICEIYGLPMDYSDGEAADNELWSSEEIIEDRVILETEITLKTGPAITMKIHEESRPSSSISNSAEIEENSIGVIKILPDDSESDYEEARKTPKNSKKNAVTITTRKSLIPIRITSLPSTPLRKSKKVTKQRLHRSAPNLSRNYGNTKIPFKRDSNIKQKFKISVMNETSQNQDRTKENVKLRINTKSKSSDHLTVTNVIKPTSPLGPNNRSNNTSPLLHKPIEVLHNLTRSPVAKRRPSTVDVCDQSNNSNTNTFNSFRVCPAISLEESFESKSIESKETEDFFDSFHVYPTLQTSQVLSLPPEDIRNNNSSNGSETKSSFEKSDSKDTEDTTYSDSHSSLGSKVKPLEYNQTLALEYIPTERENDYDSFKVCPNFSGLNQDNKGNSVQKGLKKDLDFSNQWQLSSLSSEDNLWNKSEALDNLVKMLKQPGTCENLEPGPAALLFEALFACQNFDKLHFLADVSIYYTEIQNMLS
ncbi:unnamed protein product [Diabrotica balteata]|uniref:Uncharacterized protein n=1 Tax=Diabrotica balteata TaxID=107213 RepID=A0A9N9T8H9_DIABA|nr:unnamed protein product [Diabrotica balteata]